MENKTRFTLAFLFTFLFVIGLGSAFTITPSSVSFSNGDLSKVLTIGGEAGYNFSEFSNTAINVTGEDGYILPLEITLLTGLVINDTNSTQITISNKSIVDYSKFLLGKVYSNNVVFSANKTNLTNSSISEIVNRTVSINFVNSEFCSVGETGSLEITEVWDGSGRKNDEWDWEPLKNIKIRVEVENKGDTREYVNVRLALYDSDGRQVRLSEDDKYLEQTIRISDNDDATFEFEFTLPADIKLNRDYNLFVKAYVRGKEDTQCTSQSTSLDKTFYQPIRIDVEDEYLLTDLELPSTLICGDPSQISLNFYNFGIAYDDDLMKVNLYSQNLGIDIDSHEFELDDGDSEFISFDFISPVKQTGSYKFSLTLDYDYRDSSDTFRKSKTLGTYTIRLEGNQCSIDESNLPIINAALDEDTETKVGEDLVLLINVTNNGETGDIAVVIDGYTSWANLVTPSGYSLALAKGETKTITATFTPTKAGKQEFIIKTFVGASMKERKITVEIEEGEKSLFKSIFGDVKFNLAFWLTIGIFIILILIIFVLFVKFVAASTSKE